MDPEPQFGFPTLLGLVSLALKMTAEAAAGDFSGARMSLAHVRELANRPALGNFRPSLKLLAGALSGHLHPTMGSGGLLWQPFGVRSSQQGQH